MPTKIGFHAFWVKGFYYLVHGLVWCSTWKGHNQTIHGSKGNFGCFEGKQKRGKISETKKTAHQNWFPYISHQPLFA